MANYYSAFRSNYFKVKDPEAFTAFTDRVCDIDVHTKEMDDGTYYGIFESAYSDGGPPHSMVPLSADKDDMEIDPECFEDIPENEGKDFFQLVGDYLAEGQVAIFMESGHEKLRYISGFSCAVHADGRYIWLNLSEIYKRVETEFDMKPEDYTEATY